MARHLTKVTFCLVLLCHITLEAVTENSSCKYVGVDSLLCAKTPFKLPEGIKKVSITNWKREDIGESLFDSTSWRHVEVLEFDDLKSEIGMAIQTNAFKKLQSLRELHIHTTGKYAISPDAFSSLNNLEELDLNGGGRLSTTELLPSLNGSDTLPQLRRLDLSGMQIYYEDIEMDDSFFRAICARNLTHWDTTGVVIGNVNMTSLVMYCTHLEYLNISSSKIRYLAIPETSRRFFFNMLDYQTNSLMLNHLKILDLSNVMFPLAIEISGKSERHLAFHNMFIPVTVFKSDCIKDVEVLDITSILPVRTSFWFYNIVAYPLFDMPFRLRHLNFSRNGFKWLDIRIYCIKNVHSIETVDGSDNGLQFIHPLATHCFKNVSSINFSHNMLWRMSESNSSLFEHLLNDFNQLVYINLAYNNFSTLPHGVFQSTKSLQVVDLSYNQFEQVQATFNDLPSLRELNLQGNKIKYLDQHSLSNLKAFINPKLLQFKTIINLQNNPIDCSVCDSYSFLDWLLSVNITALHDLQCTNEKQQLISVTTETLKSVNHMCRLPYIAVYTSVAIVTTIVVIVTSICLIVRHKKKLRRRDDNHERIRLIEDGAGQYEFVIFISCCHQDDEFVRAYVKHPLAEHLEDMTGLRRELISFGDRHFRLGRGVFDEIVYCISRSSVVLIIVSESYCDSDYCRSEFDIARQLQKPIVLMLKEQVDESLMPPHLRQLYKTNTRILWSFEHENYVLKTTWQNVCKSIMDLIPIDGLI